MKSTKPKSLAAKAISFVSFSQGDVDNSENVTWNVT